jgi:hypothetical protein
MISDITRLREEGEGGRTLEVWEGLKVTRR